MNCPVCGERTKVRDSREDEDCVRRRRECLSCHYVFTTIETDEDLFRRITNVKCQQNSNPLPETEGNHY